MFSIYLCSMGRQTSYIQNLFLSVPSITAVPVIHSHDLLMSALHFAQYTHTPKEWLPPKALAICMSTTTATCMEEML